MKVRCEYCNSYIDDSCEKCPSCGAPNKDFKRVANQVPTTISELEEWYKAHNLPAYETTRFFIGINYTEPKAFGIYKDDNTGKFVVYKNKDTGERKIRYEGKDEKYAVNELYMKLKEEILNQKNLNGKGKRKVNDSFFSIFKYYFFSIAIISLFLYSYAAFQPQRGYYNINGSEYYYVHGGWYVFNEEWKPTYKPSYDGNLNNYYEGENYNSNGFYSDIADSSVYDESWDYSSSSSDDWDYDSTWDSGSSWDSGGTDWGSDW